MDTAKLHGSSYLGEQQQCWWSLLVLLEEWQGENMHCGWLWRRVSTSSRGNENANYFIYQAKASTGFTHRLLYGIVIQFILCTSPLFRRSRRCSSRGVWVKPTYVRTSGLKKGGVFTRRGLSSGKLRYCTSQAEDHIKDKLQAISTEFQLTFIDTYSLRLYSHMQQVSCGLHFSFSNVTGALIIQLVKLHKKKTARTHYYTVQFGKRCWVA